MNTEVPECYYGYVDIEIFMKCGSCSSNNCGLVNDSKADDTFFPGHGLG